MQLTVGAGATIAQGLVYGYIAAQEAARPSAAQEAARPSASQPD